MCYQLKQLCIPTVSPSLPSLGTEKHAKKNEILVSDLTQDFLQALIWRIFRKDLKKKQKKTDLLLARTQTTDNSMDRYKGLG